MLRDQFKIVDLTQPLTEGAPTWNGSCGFSCKNRLEQPFSLDTIHMDAGIGTHMDAPSHLIRGGTSINDIPLAKLIVPICLIDVSGRAGADYEISADDIEFYEKQHGEIGRNSLVIGFTGWHRFWSDAKAYRNVDANGQMHFPAFSAGAAEQLLKREIAGLAIDTLSPDCLDHTFSVHKLILGSGKYIIENVGDCSQIPPTGSYAIALPLRAASTESPMRLISLIPH